MEQAIRHDGFVVEKSRRDVSLAARLAAWAAAPLSMFSAFSFRPRRPHRKIAESTGNTDKRCLMAAVLTFGYFLLSQGISHR